jgi:hypothetical protein
MNRKYMLGNGVLWAAAIVGSAMLGAPPTLTALVLPSLAVISLLTAIPRASTRH